MANKRKSEKVLIPEKLIRKLDLRLGQYILSNMYNNTSDGNLTLKKCVYCYTLSRLVGMKTKLICTDCFEEIGML